MKVERRLFHAFELSALAFVDHVDIKPFAQHHTVHPLRDTVDAVVGLNGAIAAQPIVETILAAICLIMVLISRRNDADSQTAGKK